MQSTYPALLAQFTRSTALQTKTLRLELRSFWRRILLLSFGMVLAGSLDRYAGSRTMGPPLIPPDEPAAIRALVDGNLTPFAGVENGGSHLGDGVAILAPGAQIGPRWLSDH